MEAIKTWKDIKKDCEMGLQKLEMDKELNLKILELANKKIKDGN